MSVPPGSPPSKPLIVGWIKNLATGKGDLSDALLLSDDESTGAFRARSASPNPRGASIPQQLSPDGSETTLPTRHHLTAQFLKPLGRHRARLSSNVKPDLAYSEEELQRLREQRDLFILKQQLRLQLPQPGAQPGFALTAQDSQVFGVPLAQLVAIAGVLFWLKDADLAELTKEEIPCVVAKCGLYLKARALLTEGIFRIGGSAKRVRELQYIFSLPPDYGRNVDWDGFLVHDVLQVLRRFLNSLPESLVPVHMYEQFRRPIQSRPHLLKRLLTPKDRKERKEARQARLRTREDADLSREATPLDLPGPANTTLDTAADTTMETTADAAAFQDLLHGLLMASPDNIPGSSDTPLAESSQPHTPALGPAFSPPLRQLPPRLSLADPSAAPQLTVREKLHREVNEAAKEYLELVQLLPPCNRLLLLYILDLLDYFATGLLATLMNTSSLAAVFQPSILLHPDHDLDPTQYEVLRRVVEFLIKSVRSISVLNEKGKGVTLNVPSTVPFRSVSPGASQPLLVDVPGTQAPPNLPLQSRQNGRPLALLRVFRHHSKSLPADSNQPELLALALPGTIDTLLGAMGESLLEDVLEFDLDNDSRARPITPLRRSPAMGPSQLRDGFSLRHSPSASVETASGPLVSSASPRQKMVAAVPRTRLLVEHREEGDGFSVVSTSPAALGSAIAGILAEGTDALTSTTGFVSLDRLATTVDVLTPSTEAPSTCAEPLHTPGVGIAAGTSGALPERPPVRVPFQSGMLLENMEPCAITPLYTATPPLLLFEESRVSPAAEDNARQSPKVR